MKLYCIVDVKHSFTLAAGTSDEDYPHHCAPSDEPRALWLLEPADDDSFRLRDAAHGRYLVAPEVYDGRLYHRSHASDAGARWRAYPMHDGPGGSIAVTIKDCRHGLALVAGDDADGRIYHDIPNGRMNAFWTLVPVGETLS